MATPGPPLDLVRRSAAELARFMRGKQRLLVLTGAGCSTESGIPDYRSPSGSYSRGHIPIQHEEFVRNAAKRQRCGKNAVNERSRGACVALVAVLAEAAVRVAVVGAPARLVAGGVVAPHVLRCAVAVVVGAPTPFVVWHR